MSEANPLKEEYYDSVKTLSLSPQWKDYERMLRDEVGRLFNRFRFCEDSELSGIRKEILQTEKIIGLPKQLFEKFESKEKV